MTTGTPSATATGAHQWRGVLEEYRSWMDTSCSANARATAASTPARSSTSRATW